MTHEDPFEGVRWPTSGDGVTARACCPTYAHELHREACPTHTRHGDLKDPIRRQALEELAREWQWKGWADVLLPASGDLIANAQSVTDWLLEKACPCTPESPEHTHLTGGYAL